MVQQQLVIGVIILVILVVIWYMYKKPAATNTVAHYTPVQRGYVARMKSNVPSLKHDVYSGFCAAGCNCGGIKCGRPADAAKTLLDKQKSKKEPFTSGGNRLKRNIRNGNKAPERQIEHLTTGQEAADNDAGDYMEYTKNKSINPEVKDTHKLYLAERQMYSQQPAIPSDVIESNYGNFWGLARRSFKAPSIDARQQFGANDEDYDPKWGNTYSF